MNAHFPRVLISEKGTASIIVDTLVGPEVSFFLNF